MSAADAMERFAALGEDIARRWSAVGAAEASFAELATDCLSRHAAGLRVDPLAALERILDASGTPEQRMLDSRFGQPPFTVFSGQGFYIELLTWLDGTTAIHQHGFNGAFMLLGGSSLQTVYRFEEGARPAPGLRLGALSLERAELLAVGDVRMIRSGAALIHSVFHLDRPSSTLVVRTSGDPAALPQWQYWRPGLAFDGFTPNELRRRRVEAVQTLLEVRPLSALKTLERALAEVDLETAFYLLQPAAAKLGEGPAMRALHQVLRQRHGADADRVASSLAFRIRELQLTALRSRVTDPPGRFLLALLLNAPDLETFRRLWAQRVPAAGSLQAVLQSWAALGDAIPQPDRDLLRAPGAAERLASVLEGKTQSAGEWAGSSWWGPLLAPGPPSRTANRA
jgi:hypothetical protein